MKAFGSFVITTALGNGLLPVLASEHAAVTARGWSAEAATLAEASAGLDVPSDVIPVPTCDGPDCPDILIQSLSDGTIRVQRGRYGPKENATITFQTPAYVVANTRTERSHDKLTIQQHVLSGDDLKFNWLFTEEAEATINWETDYSVSGSGWWVDISPIQSLNCTSDQNPPICTGISCDAIQIFCDGDDFVVSRGFAGYEDDEVATISFGGPALLNFDVRATEGVLIAGERYSWQERDKWVGLWGSGTQLIDWSWTSNAIPSRGWQITITPGSPFPSWLFPLVLVCVAIVGCIIWCIISWCLRKRKVASQGAAELVGQPDQQSMSLRYAPPSAAYVLPGAGFQPDNGAPFQFQAPAGFRPNPPPGFQLQQP